MNIRSTADQLQKGDTCIPAKRGNFKYGFYQSRYRAVAIFPSGDVRLQRVTKEGLTSFFDVSPSYPVLRDIQDDPNLSS